jgi:spermidine synthase
LDLRYPLVLLCFFASGFAGLLYETAWTREFSFVFGTSNLAVATVLAAYMGGLSLGAAIAARTMHRIRRPVLVYGLLELGIAASALAVPYLIRGVTLLYRPLFATAEILPEEGGLASAIFYALASFLILGIPTTLMGATLPMLARQAVRQESQIGGRIGTLYAVNTAGAIAGTIATAFLLLPELGLRLTVATGASLNAIVFVAAALLSRGAATFQAGPAPARASGIGLRGKLVLAVSFAASVASFTYENVWFRLFEHVLGASTYAFSTMLASFLVGIALGGALAAPFARTREGSTRGLAATQIGAAVFSFLAFGFVDHLPALAMMVNQPGLLGVVTRASVAAALLLPSTLCIGASFPFAVRALAEDVEGAAATSARVYAWSTLGAIVGSLSAGFYVIPTLGFAGTLVATVLVNLVAAAMAACALRPVAKRVLAVAGAAALCLVVVRPDTPWGVLGTGPLALETKSTKLQSVDPDRIIYFGVGRSSTVLLSDDQWGWRLRTNGLPEAIIERPGAVPSNSPTARWLAMLPAFSPSPPRDLLVIGLGGGVAVEAVPASFEHIDVVELEPEVLAANLAVADRRNRNPLADPRLRVLLNDARGALMLTELRYGAIVSQPSHPWTAGASHLYTRDFFVQVREHLAPGGVFVQWMGLQFVDESLFRSLIATLVDVFPYVRVYQPDLGSVLLVSSDAPLDLESQVEAAVAREPENFARLGVRVREDLAAALVLDDAGTRAIAEGAPLVTDDHNLFATHSPRILSHPLRSADRLVAAYDPLIGGADGLDSLYLIRRLVQMRRLARAERLAQSLENPLERLLAQMEAALGRGEHRKALDFATRALALDPDSPLASFRSSMLSGRPPAGARATQDGVMGVLADAQRLRIAREWEALERFDGALAAVDTRHPAYNEAQQLRVDWRLGEGSAQAATEAVTLLDLEPWGGGELLARRALAGVQSRLTGVAGQSLDALAKHLESRRGLLSPLAAEWALAALDATPAAELPPDTQELRRRIVRVRDRMTPKSASATSGSPAGPLVD